jgi:xylulokinase
MRLSTIRISISAGFANNADLQWSNTLLQTFDIPKEIMPRIVAPTDQIGSVCETAAYETGLVAGTPIFAGSGDTAASFLAAGAVSPGICVDVSGTASVFGATAEEFRPDQIDGMLGVGRSVVPGLWHPYSYVNGGGMNLEWYRNMLASVRNSDLTYTELNDLASDVDLNSDLPIFVPHLAGRVSPSDPDMRGAWLGVDWTHTPGALYRSILESIALEYRLYKDRLVTLNPEQKMTELRNTGGGNTSELWKQIKADAMNVSVVGVSDFAGATHGVAMIAAVGAGALFLNC